MSDESLSSLGEQRVGTNFNPSGSVRVSRIKQKAADLIDEINSVSQRPDRSSETIRCAAIAMTHVETASMFAVKAATRHSGVK